MNEAAKERKAVADAAARARKTVAKAASTARGVVEEEATVKEELIAGLATRVAKLDANTTMLVHTVRRTRLERLILFALVLLCAVLGYRTYNQSKDNGDLVAAGQAQAAANHKTGLAIQSCTVPTGKCYQRSSRATATAIASINTYTLIAVECARAGGTNTTIEICVQRRVREELAQLGH